MNATYYICIDESGRQKYNVDDETMTLAFDTVECRSSVVEIRMPDSQSREPGFESSLCYRFEVWPFPFSPLGCVNEYLAIDSGGNVSE